jgi:hypothetical protein
MIHSQQNFKETLRTHHQMMCHIPREGRSQAPGTKTLKFRTVKIVYEICSHMSTIKSISLYIIKITYFKWRSGSQGAIFCSQMQILQLSVCCVYNVFWYSNLKYLP